LTTTVKNFESSFDGGIVAGLEVFTRKDGNGDIRRYASSVE
jgi:hypothetical protein